MATPVLIPLINPNEPEAFVAALHVLDGQAVSTGDLLCTLETTKSASDIHAECDGYVIGLRLTPGQSARAGEILCYLAETQDWKLATELVVQQPEGQSSLPEGLRITQPALAFARRSSVDLTSLPVGPLVTKSMVRAALEHSPGETGMSLPESPFDPTAIIVYGGGGHGKSLIDLLRSLGVYRVAGVVDDGLEAGSLILGVPVLGGKDVLPGLKNAASTWRLMPWVVLEICPSASRSSGCSARQDLPAQR